MQYINGHLKLRHITMQCITTAVHVSGTNTFWLSPVSGCAAGDFSHFWRLRHVGGSGCCVVTAARCADAATSGGICSVREGSGRNEIVVDVNSCSSINGFASSMRSCLCLHWGVNSRVNSVRRLCNITSAIIGRTCTSTLRIYIALAKLKAWMYRIPFWFFTHLFLNKLSTI